MTPEDRGAFDSALTALKEGRADDAIATLEALADRGVVGVGIAFDRGLAYAARARAGGGLPGDLGRSAHAFEEALRRDPHDRSARTALDEVRREIARREIAAGWKAEEVGSPPMWRAIVVASPADGWASLSIVGSLMVSVALGVRPFARRGARLAASTVAIVGAVLVIAATALGLGARYLRLRVHEAVVVAPHVVTTPLDGGEPIKLVEGTRVDLVDERLSEARVRTGKGEEGWVPRDSLRSLPPYRP